MDKLAYKLSLWLGSMFLSTPGYPLNTNSDWKCWAWYMMRLDYADTEQDIRTARNWVGKHCPLRVEIACFIVYFAAREPLSFLLFLIILIAGPMYAVYFAVTEFLISFGTGV